MGIFDIVRDCISARKAAEYYGLRINRNSMACCPFHNDRRPSMKIDRRFYCFGCGKKGDAVDYVAETFGLDLKSAAEKICRDFGIDYDKAIHRPPPKIKPCGTSMTDEQLHLISKAEQYVFKVLCDYYHLLKKWKTKYKPKTEDEEWHPYFIEALREIDHVEYLLDTLLTGDAPDRAFLISDQGTGVRRIEKRLQRINENLTGGD